MKPFPKSLMNTAVSFQVFSLMLFMTTGCIAVGVAYEILPIPVEGWESTGRQGGMLDYVKYECSDFTISVSQAQYSGPGLMAVGIVVPVVPIPIPKPSSGEVVLIYLILNGNFPTPNMDSLYVQIGEKIVKPIKFDCSRKTADFFSYDYEFPLSFSGTETFVLLFNEPFMECSLPPLTYKKKLRVGSNIF